MKKFRAYNFVSKKPKNIPRKKNIFPPPGQYLTKLFKNSDLSSGTRTTEMLSNF